MIEFRRQRALRQKRFTLLLAKVLMSFPGIEKARFTLLTTASGTNSYLALYSDIIMAVIQGSKKSNCIHLNAHAFNMLVLLVLKNKNQCEACFHWFANASRCKPVTASVERGVFGHLPQ